MSLMRPLLGNLYTPLSDGHRRIQVKSLYATQRWGRQMGSSSVTSRLICMGAEKVRQSNVACFSYKVFPFSKIVHITATLSATRQAQIPQIFG